MGFDCKSEQIFSIHSLHYIIPKTHQGATYACYVAGLLAQPNPAQLTPCVPEDALFMGVFCLASPPFPFSRVPWTRAQTTPGG